MTPTMIRLLKRPPFKVSWELGLQHMNFGDTQLNSSHPFGWSPGSFPRTCRSLPLRVLTIPLRQKLCCCCRRPAAQSRHGRGSVLQRRPGLPVASPAHSGASQTVLLSPAAWPPRPKACVSPTPEIQVRLSFVLGCSGWRVSLGRRGTAPHTFLRERVCWRGSAVSDVAQGHEQWR